MSSGVEVGEKSGRVGLSCAMLQRWKKHVLVIMCGFVVHQAFDVSEAGT